MPAIPAMYLIHLVTVTPLLGRTGTGPIYGTPRPINATVSEETKQTRNADGEEVVTTASLVLYPKQPENFAPGSKVTLPSGRVSKVIGYHEHDAGSLGAWSHAEVTCE
jgi:hypothetical protein